MSNNQQKDTTASDGGEGLRRKEKDDTGGPRGDQLGHAVDAAAARDARDGGKPPPSGKDGASSS